MAEHLEGAEIIAIEIDTIPNAQGGFAVGTYGITHIEAFTKSGMLSDIPYVRVWAGDAPLAEFCQHNIVGVYFKRLAAIGETP
jgi:hypothetical protein